MLKTKKLKINGRVKNLYSKKYWKKIFQLRNQLEKCLLENNSPKPSILKNRK